MQIERTMENVSKDASSMDSLSIQCDSSKLDEIYKKLRSEPSILSDVESGTFMQRFFNMVVRPFSRTIGFAIFSIAAYAVNVRVFEKSGIPMIIGALSLLVLIISFAIDMYFKKKRNTDTTAGPW